MAEYLPYKKLLKLTDGLGRIRKVLGYALGDGSGLGVMYEKVCELVTVNQAGADGIYTIRARDIIHFGIGDNIGFWDTSAKIQYTENITIKSIDRSANTITADGKFTAAPVTTDFLVLFNTVSSVAGIEIEEYIRDLGVTKQELDLLGSAQGMSDDFKKENAIHPLIRNLILSLDSHYANGIGNFLEDIENPVITTPTNAVNATIDIPNEEAKWFTSGDEVTYYDVSAEYRVFEHLPVSSVGAEDSGSTTGTTLITLTGTWSIAPFTNDYLQLYDRICPEFKKLCESLVNVIISANRCWSPEIELGTYAATGAATGTFADGSAVDTDLYGDEDLEVEVINQAIGANNLVLALTGSYYDESGDIQTDAGLTCTIPNASVVGTRVAITPGDSNRRYYDITAVTNSNGSNGDDIKIVTKLDRLIQRS